MELTRIAQTLTETPDVLQALLGSLDDATLSFRPNPQAWCIKEIIGHLIESDKGAFRERIAEIVAGADEITPVSPTAPLEPRNDQATPLSDLLDELRAERVISAEYILTLTPADLDKTSNFPKYGIFSAGDFVYEWPYHDHDHIQQILGVLKGNYLPLMSDTMRDALS